MFTPGELQKGCSDERPFCVMMGVDGGRGGGKV